MKALKLQFSLIVSSLLALPSPALSCKMAPRTTPPKSFVSFDSCSALENHLQKNQKSNLWGKRTKSRKGKQLSVGRMTGGALARSNAPAAAMEESFEADSLAQFGGAKKEVKKDRPDSKTGTNNQVKNVDEADFVKFTGKHIIQLQGGTLKVLKAWPANEMNLLASYPIKGNTRELLVYKNNVVTLSNAGSKFEVTILDISNPSAPRELTKFEIPGQYKTARLIGSTLRIVNQQYNGWRFNQVSAVRNTDRSWFRNIEPQLPKLNITNTVQVTAGQRQELNSIGDCKNIYVPKEAPAHHLTRLVSIDLEEKKYGETLAFFMPQHVYSSPKAVYLTNNVYGQDENKIWVNRTAIHKFRYTTTDTISYRASGLVNGNLLNQFSMDEFKGNLRVATNSNEYVKENKLWGRSNTRWQMVNRVQVLKERKDQLKVIGKTKNLAKGERIYSVRFNGKKGYMVTFRQVDPLFTLDLSNPYRPRAVGELKIPGFSTYIHMLDDKHLLTIGKDADPNTGRAKGLKLSIFDTSNFKNPREVKSLLFNAKTQSEATYEHKAFTFYRERGILAIPVSDHERSSLLLFKVTQEDIRPSGELSMTDMFDQMNGAAVVRRSFFADNIVYAIGGRGVRAAHLNNPSTPLSTVNYDQRISSNNVIGW